MENSKVFVAIYSYTTEEDFQDPYIRTKVFDSEIKAEEWLKKDYETALGECEDEENVHQVISSGNYRNNAEILVGEKDGEIVWGVHRWRIATKTINFAD